MKFSLNYNNFLKKLLKKPRYPLFVGLAVFVITLVWGLSGKAYSPGWIFDDVKKTFSKIQTDLTIQSGLSTVPTKTPEAFGSSFSHSSIITTIFWVGESANDSNGGIANAASTWDEQWQQHYGGYDDPNSRNGYLPKSFKPNENSFYFALPYSDIDGNGDRKTSAKNCPLYSASKSYSWCKNSWIAIRHNSKVAYAQWEDAGPFGEDDISYVFGSALPSNRKGEKAGLDVSPAVRDYLELSDVDKCDWGFIVSADVPSGPWKQTITTTAGEKVN